MKSNDKKGPASDRYQVQRDRAERAGHGEVFRFWDRLNDDGRDRLVAQVERLDFDLVARLCAEHLGETKKKLSAECISPAANVVTLPKTDEDEERRHEARRVGEELIAAGKVASLTVAGGQGTRLGFDGPKGCFPIGPVTDRSLFEYYALHLRAIGRKHGVTPPWYIMTSTNYEATRDFFNHKDYFGLDKDDVVFFVQDTLPAVSLSGELLLDSMDHIFESPNGHGGTFSSLSRSGSLDDMRRRGIEYISYFQVDNPLVRVADPEFVGFHVLHGADMSGKTLRKRAWDEKMGTLCSIKDRLRIVEYTEMVKELARKTDDDGDLVFWTGNPATHIISVDFAETIAGGSRSLPYHLASKKVSCLDETGEVVIPEKSNGYKFECFIFDALAETSNTMLMEIDRATEYSPVKNAKGRASVVESRQAVSNYFGTWLEAAGVDVPRCDDTGDVDGRIEVSPLFAACKEEFVDRIDGDTVFKDPMLFE